MKFQDPSLVVTSSVLECDAARRFFRIRIPYDATILSKQAQGIDSNSNSNLKSNQNVDISAGEDLSLDMSFNESFGTEDL